jgi:hypothetical protein
MCRMSQMPTASQVIDRLGGPVAVSKLCGCISPQAVTQWRRNGIPQPRRMYLEVVAPHAFEPMQAEQSEIRDAA